MLDLDTVIDMYRAMPARQKAAYDEFRDKYNREGEHEKQKAGEPDDRP